MTRAVRQTINGHRVAVPADMTVVKQFGFPGAYDHIEYRGFELTTFEELVDGCRFCFSDNPEMTFKSLDAFRAYVNSYYAFKDSKRLCF